MNKIRFWDTYRDPWHFSGQVHPQSGGEIGVGTIHPPVKVSSGIQGGSFGQNSSQTQDIRQTNLAQKEKNPRDSISTVSSPWVSKIYPLLTDSQKMSWSGINVQGAFLIYIIDIKTEHLFNTSSIQIISCCCFPPWCQITQHFV